MHSKNEPQKNMKKIWLTWEDHRRSRELASAFGAEYLPIIGPENRFLRYFLLCSKTLFLLIKIRPSLIFCQNPSIVLNTFLCCLKNLFGYHLIADRHSNFKFYTLGSNSPKWRLFHTLSKFTLRRSDLTIVTNDHLAQLVKASGGNAVILPDKLPSFPGIAEKELQGNKSIVFISTFSADEPINAVIDAFRLLPEDLHLYITGNFRKKKNLDQFVRSLPRNVSLTGFLDEQSYLELLTSADILLVLTNQEYILNCGSYEAVSLGKPMVLGDTATIREYFFKGAIYSRLDSQSLANNIQEAFIKKSTLEEEVRELKVELTNDWNIRFNSISRWIKLNLPD